MNLLISMNFEPLMQEPIRDPELSAPNYQFTE